MAYRWEHCGILGGVKWTMIIMYVPIDMYVTKSLHLYVYMWMVTIKYFKNYLWLLTGLHYHSYWYRLVDAYGDDVNM